MPPNHPNSHSNSHPNRNTKKHNTPTGSLMTGSLLTPDLMTSDLMTGNTTKQGIMQRGLAGQGLMTRDAAKLGVFAVLLAASGALFYTNYLHTPKRDAPVITKEDERVYQDQVRQHEALATLPDYIIAGS